MPLPITEWCSFSNPQGDCRPIQGICKPMTIKSRDLFRTLQKAVNALLRQDQKTLIAEDARPGPLTVAAVNLYASTPFRDCNELVANVVDVTVSMIELAKKRESTAKANGVVSLPGVKKAGFPWPIAIILGGIAAWMYFEDKKPKQRRRS